VDIVRKTCDYRKRGTPCGKPVPDNLSTEFALAPDSYAADLCVEHRQVLAKAFAPFVEISRRSRAIASVNTRGRKVLRGKGGKTFTTKDVRLWLVEQGRDVPEGGRLPNSEIERYMASVKH